MAKGREGAAELCDGAAAGACSERGAGEAATGGREAAGEAVTAVREAAGEAGPSATSAAPAAGTAANDAVASVPGVDGAASAPAAGATIVPVVPALEARGLTCAWGEGSDVVRGVDLRVDAGQTVCIVGKSGCGKTTILHALSGLSKPREGAVLLHGQDISGVPGRVSYMLQKDLLLPSRTILDNAILPLVIAGEPAAQAREKARPLIERFGLAGCEDKWPSQLSGGMRQRAAFLRTYLMGNDVVLLDEPFSALDALTRADIRRWYAQMAAELGLASIVITHDVDEAVLMASRIYVLRGEPKAGAPSTVAGEVEIDHATGGNGAFDLTDEFLFAKRQVMALLG